MSASSAATGVISSSLHKVLPQFDAEIGPPARFGMAVHGVIEIAPGIGKVVAHAQPLGCEHRDGDPRGAIIGVVEHADLPRARLVRGGQARGEAVEREDQRGLCGCQPLLQRGMIGAVEAVEPRCAVGTDIAGDCVPVAGFGDKTGGGFLAVQVAHQAADGGDVGGDGVVAGKEFGDGGGADINRDVFVQQVRGDAEGDVRRHMIAGMVSGANDPAGGRRTELVEGFAHTPPVRSPRA